MEKKTLYIDFTPGLNPGDHINSVDVALGDGWVLDPLFRSNPVKLESVAIYHLIKYSEEELAEALNAMDERKPGKYDDVIAVRDVSSDEVAALVAEGWLVHEMYSKSTKMIKRKKGDGEALLKATNEALDLATPIKSLPEEA